MEASSKWVRVMGIKEYHDKYNKEYYAARKEQRKIQVLARQKHIKSVIREYKLAKGCERCGYNKSARALQFHHHNNDKAHNVARMVAQGRAIENIMIEIAKCEIVCSNCHAEIHEAEELD
jgi:hypothetical protein